MDLPLPGNSARRGERCTADSALARYRNSVQIYRQPRRDPFRAYFDKLPLEVNSIRVPSPDQERKRAREKEGETGREKDCLAVVPRRPFFRKLPRFYARARLIASFVVRASHASRISALAGKKGERRGRHALCRSMKSLFTVTGVSSRAEKPPPPRGERPL